MMTKNRAEDILNFNKIKFNEFGVQILPVKTVGIATFGIHSTEENGWAKTAEIVGLLRSKSEMPPCNFDFRTSSFLVEFEKTYYFRDDFHQALQVILALQTIYNYDLTDALRYGFSNSDN